MRLKIQTRQFSAGERAGPSLKSKGAAVSNQHRRYVMTVAPSILAARPPLLPPGARDDWDAPAAGPSHTFHLFPLTAMASDRPVHFRVRFVSRVDRDGALPRAVHPGPAAPLGLLFSLGYEVGRKVNANLSFQ